MSHYADSSFLVSCYVVDANTAQAKAYLSRTATSLAFTGLHALEVRNAFKLGSFRGFFTALEAKAAWANVENDLQSGRLAKIATKWPLIFRVATRLSEQHSTVLGTRSLDILHVATAKVLRSIEFVSFDARQRELAAAVNLKVGP